MCFANLKVCNDKENRASALCRGRRPVQWKGGLSLCWPIFPSRLSLGL